MSKRSSSKRTRKSTQRPASQTQQTKQTSQTKPTSQGRPASQPARKVRGGWLTAILIFIVLDGLLGAALLIAFRRADGPPLPVLATLAALAAVGSIVAGVALWYWKRWGLYLYIVATAATICVGLIVLPSLFTAFHAIIPLGILGAVLSNQHKLPLLT